MQRTPVVLPPTPEQRQAAFIEAYNALVKQYGVQIVGQVVTRQLGPVTQCEAQLVIVPVPDWKAE